MNFLDRISKSNKNSSSLSERRVVWCGRTDMTKPIIASRNFAKRLIPAEEHRTEFLNKNKNWTLGRIDSKIKQTGRDKTEGGRDN